MGTVPVEETRDKEIPIPATGWDSEKPADCTDASEMKAGTNPCTTHNVDGDVKTTKKKKKKKKKKVKVNEEQSAVSHNNSVSECNLQQNEDALEMEIATLRKKLQIS